VKLPLRGSKRTAAAINDMALIFINKESTTPTKIESVGRPSFILTDRVLRVVTEEGISEQMLAEMLARSAVTSLRGCNRRYHAWIFTVHGDIVVEMQRAEMVEIGRGRSRMMEEHEACAGIGCRHCGWVGSIARWITDRDYDHPSPKPRQRMSATRRGR
jgi:hypothetical protein